MLEIATTTLNQLQRIAGPSSTLNETPRPPTSATSSIPPQPTKETPTRPATSSIPPQPIKETLKPIEQDKSTFDDELAEFAYRLNDKVPKVTQQQLLEALGKLQAREIEHVVAMLVWMAKGSQHGSSYNDVIGTEQDPMVGASKDADFDVKQYVMSREDYG